MRKEKTPEEVEAQWKKKLERTKKWKKEHKDQVTLQAKKYYKKKSTDPEWMEQNRKRRKTWLMWKYSTKKGREEERAKASEYRRTHREIYRESAKKQRKKPGNKEKKSTYNKKYREKHHNNLSQYQVEYRKSHKEKMKNYAKKRRIKEKELWTPEQSRNHSLKYNYGLTSEDYKKLLSRQNNKCAICFNPFSHAYLCEGIKKYNLPNIDHKHTDKQIKLKDRSLLVRGILCSNCNLLIGHAHDSPDLLRSAAAYLEKYAADSTDGKDDILQES